MNKTNAVDDKIQAVSPEFTSALELVDTKMIKKNGRSLIKTNPIFLQQYKYYIYNCKPK